MKNRVAGLLVAAVVGLISVGVSGCAAKTETIGFTQSEVTVTQGEELVIDFGEVNHSVGSEWVVVAQPDPAVLGPADAQSEYLGEKGSVGGPSHLTYHFAAVGSGMTKIQFEYQFRGAVPDDPAEQKTSTIAVTVEAP
ncbi:protease inhibitor I42 family protein [Leucobacter sp. NPDC058333]|uniref:protease inhibitor I42 family protein n=1 Tax=Leucobacter sp. NPDC058333 TaxID=3346450 RepID=UPI00365A6989